MDVALLPWAFRFYVFEHYRGPAFAIPREDPGLAAYCAWLDHALDLPQVPAPPRTLATGLGQAGARRAV